MNNTNFFLDNIGRHVDYTHVTANLFARISARYSQLSGITYVARTKACHAT